MPSDSSRNTLTRQWELLKLLPSHRPGKTAAELTRDLAELGYKVTIYEKRKRSGGMMHLIPDYRLDKGVVRTDIDFLKGKAEIAVVGTQSIRVFDEKGCPGVREFLKGLR